MGQQKRKSRWRRWRNVGVVLPGLLLADAGCMCFSHPNAHVDNCSVVPPGARPTGLTACRAASPQMSKMAMFSAGMMRLRQIKAAGIVHLRSS